MRVAVRTIRAACQEMLATDSEGHGCGLRPLGTQKGSTCGTKKGIIAAVSAGPRRYLKKKALRPIHGLETTPPGAIRNQPSEYRCTFSALGLRTTADDLIARNAPRLAAFRETWVLVADLI